MNRAAYEYSNPSQSNRSIRLKLKVKHLVSAMATLLLVSACGGGDSSSDAVDVVDKYLGTWTACTYTGTNYTKRTRTFAKLTETQAMQTIRTQDIFDDAACTVVTSSGSSSVTYKTTIGAAATLQGLVGESVVNALDDGTAAPGYLAIVGTKLYVGALPLDDKGFPTQWSVPYTR